MTLFVVNRLFYYYYYILIKKHYLHYLFQLKKRHLISIEKIHSIKDTSYIRKKNIIIIIIFYFILLSFFPISAILANVKVLYFLCHFSKF